MCSKTKAAKRSYLPFQKVLLSCPLEDEPVVSLVLDKQTRKWSKIEVQSSKLNPSTQVFETKIDSVEESSLSDDPMALVPSTCDRHTFAHVLCIVFCCKRFVCSANLSTAVQWLAHP